MPVTLAEIQKNSQDDIQAGVIEELRRASAVLDRIPFDPAVTPGTNQGTLTYGYTRLTTPASAAHRPFNAEYTAQQATKDRYTVDLTVFGGAFEVDRVFQRVGGLVDEVAFQTQEKVTATRTHFHDLFINGDSNNAGEFDGLDEALSGSSTEVGAAEEADWLDVDSQAKAFAQLETIDEWLSMLDQLPDAIYGNRRSINRFKFLGRWAGYLTEDEDAFGRKVSRYDGIELVDLGDKANGTDPVIGIDDGLTDLYAVRFGIDAVHGVTLGDESELVRAYLDEFQPGWRASGAVRRGEIEMVGAVALKRTKAAGVLRNVRVAPPTAP